MGIQSSIPENKQHVIADRGFEGLVSGNLRCIIIVSFSVVRVPVHKHVRF